MRKKTYSILKQKEDCVLLSRVVYGDGVYHTKYIVRDIENDIIFSGYDCREDAESIFDSYDLEKVREERKKEFDSWLEENAEA